MRMDRITYQKIFPIGMYINEKIGVEMILNEGDSAMDAIAEARKFVHEAHLKYSSHSTEPFEEVVQQIEKKPILTKLDSLINDINTCQEIRVLESYKLIVKNNKVLQDAYNQKLKELQS